MLLPLYLAHLIKWCQHLLFDSYSDPVSQSNKPSEHWFYFWKNLSPSVPSTPHLSPFCQLLKECALPIQLWFLLTHYLRICFLGDFIVCLLLSCRNIHTWWRSNSFVYCHVSKGRKLNLYSTSKHHTPFVFYSFRELNTWKVMILRKSSHAMPILVLFRVLL